MPFYPASQLFCLCGFFLFTFLKSCEIPSCSHTLSYLLNLKVVQYKQQSRLEEKRKKALDLQLDFIVGQTEKYSDLLSKSLAPIRPAETVVSPQKSLPNPVEEDGEKFSLLKKTFFLLLVLTATMSQTAFRADSLVQTGTLS